MSNEKNNGGPAFPHTFKYGNLNTPGGEVTDMMPGMTLRDYFAAKAMGHLIVPRYISAWQWLLRQFGNQANVSGSTPESVSASAYAYADAMLKAREQ